MSEKTIKTWIDIAPEYIDFFLKFIRKPPKAFKNRFETGKVSSDLTSILLGGVVLSYLLILVAGSSNLQNDPSKLANWLRKLGARDILLLPVAGLLCTLAFAIITHLLGKIATIVAKFGGKNEFPIAKLGGSIEDSVNAALGFASVYLPIFVIVLCLTSWLPLHLAQSIGLVLAIAMGIFPVIYFPWSLSVTHSKTKGYQAFFSMCLGFCPVLLLWSLLKGAL